MDPIQKILDEKGFYCPALKLKSLKPPCKQLKSRPILSEAVLTYGEYVWIKTPVVPIVCQHCNYYDPPVSVVQVWEVGD